jgi:hypothetical protein
LLRCAPPELRAVDAGKLDPRRAHALAALARAA